ncbi:MAG: hypothetical protein QG560_1106 [Campylobacterota bacterium]|nr:hypothetical protein [Campylobacterota bacterium]
MKKVAITFALLLPAILSLLVVAAHFLRYNNMIIIGIIALLILLLLVKHKISARLVQIGLLLATLEWVVTAQALISYRLEYDMPWIRLSMIMCLVILFTFGSIFTFKTKTLKERYAL